MDEILTDKVLNGCIHVLADGPRYETETMQELRKVDKTLKRYDLANIQSALLKLKEIGILKEEKGLYSLKE